MKLNGFICAFVLHALFSVAKEVDEVYGLDFAFNKPTTTFGSIAFIDSGFNTSHS